MSTHSDSGPMSSGQILKVLHALNSGEIEQAELALYNSTNPQVNESAQMIRQDHVASNERIFQLAEKAGIQLEDHALSEELTERASQLKDKLAKLKDERFDREYLQRQMELHQQALDTVRSQLIPNAQDSQVESLLMKEEPKLQHHLQEARKSYHAIAQPPGP